MPSTHALNSSYITMMFMASKMMHQRVYFSVLISVLLISSSPISCLQHCSNPATEQVRAGYWFPSSNRYSPLSQINTTLYTHLCYSSLALDSSNFRVALPVSPDELSLLASFSTSLKSRDLALKTLISISSIESRSAENSTIIFSSMVGNVDNRAAFISSAIEFARTYAFDGFDFSWQFPTSPSDMANLGILLQEWRARIVEEAKTVSPALLLTASVYFSDHLFNADSSDLDYPIQALSASLDWVNVQSFAYHSSGDVTITAADSPLYDVSSHFSTNYGITSWLDAGMPPCKLVMGIPLYGRSWFLKNKAKYGMGAEVVAAGPKQKLSNQTGILAYFEIKQSLEDPDAELLYDNLTMSAYIHFRNTWISFDNPQVVEVKIEYAREKELLGYFLWPVSFDMNSTISKLAFDVWIGDLASANAEAGVSNMQAVAPVQVSPKDLGRSRTPSTSGCGFFSHNFVQLLSCSILVVLLSFAIS